MGPSAEEKAEALRLQDSIATAEAETQRLNEPAIEKAVAEFKDTTAQAVAANPTLDSLAQEKLKVHAVHHLPYQNRYPDYHLHRHLIILLWLFYANRILFEILDLYY